MKLNEILCSEEQGECLYLQIKNGSHLIKLSKIEFEIIAYYTQVLNKQAVIQFFSDQLKISEEQLDALLGKAKQTKLLVDLEEGTGAGVFAFGCKRRKAILEVCTVDFTHTRLEHIAAHKKVQRFVFFTLGTIVVAVGLLVLLYPFSFVEHYKKTLYLVPYSFSQLLLFIYLGVLISIGIHEFGHYFFYKRYNGKSSVFGFGLLFFILPVMYNKLYISLVDRRSHRMLIHSGGFIFDVLFSLAIIGGIILLKDRAPVLVFMGYSMLISICIRSLFNLNVFLPQTDGYFVLSDCLKTDQLFQKSSVFFMRLLKDKPSVRSVGYGLFFVLSCLSIAGAWLFFAMPLFLLLYYAFSA
ncbi:hypothetical protein H4K35_08835 [Myroides sp. NP-2]|uniref:hypothetical protein n=1 Tax=Myroides sp. NP-2 TaxID=2759945 RepID=UPI0015FC7F9E|nr:hypothetical protein [Myroides sp. NP-2]MBB1150234.1 hypothetical protein [Myroides sp. NP-2]